LTEKEPVKHADNGLPPVVSIIPVDQLLPSPYQARISYDEGKLKRLADSIAHDGVIQAIIVCRVGDHFEVVAGWARVLACKIAGKKGIPAMIRDLSETQKAKLGVMENLQRQDLNVVEKARAYRILQDICKMTQEEIGRAFGVSRDIIAQALRILTFPQEVQNLLLQGIITVSHAEALARLSSTPELLMEGIGEVTSKKLTSSQTEKLVADILERTPLRKDIYAFINSEEFLLILAYLVPFPPRKVNFCPFCLDSSHLGYDEENVTWKCSSCGWTSEGADYKWWNLVNRARYYLLKKKGIENFFTQTWKNLNPQ
jgi:ParB family chromosome partitioning protein